MSGCRGATAPARRGSAVVILQSGRAWLRTRFARAGQRRIDSGTTPSPSWSYRELTIRRLTQGVEASSPSGSVAACQKRVTEHFARIIVSVVRRWICAMTLPLVPSVLVLRPNRSDDQDRLKEAREMIQRSWKLLEQPPPSTFLGGERRGLPPAKVDRLFRRNEP